MSFKFDESEFFEYSRPGRDTLAFQVPVEYGPASPGELLWYMETQYVIPATNACEVSDQGD